MKQPKEVMTDSEVKMKLETTMSNNKRRRNKKTKYQSKNNEGSNVIDKENKITSGSEGQVSVTEVMPFCARNMFKLLLKKEVERQNPEKERHDHLKKEMRGMKINLNERFTNQEKFQDRYNEEMVVIGSFMKD